MLLRLRGQLQVPTAAQRSYNIHGLRLIKGSVLLPEIDEALAEWTRLDYLVAQELMQRQRIAARISAFVHFAVGVRAQLRRAARKRRRPLTSEQTVIFAAKLRATRKARGTLGKRQKKKVKGY